MAGLGDMLEWLVGPSTEHHTDKELEQNLYASGYQGMHPTGINQHRGLIGSVLQGVGVLDPADPRDLTAYEKYLVSQGIEGIQDRNLKFEHDRSVLTQSRFNNKASRLKDILGIADVTGQAPQELLSDAPDTQDDVAAFLKIRGKGIADKDRAENLKLNYEKARLHFIMKGGGRMGGKSPEQIAQEAAGKSEKEQLARVKSFESGTFNKPLVKEFQDFLGGTDFDTKDVTKGSLFDAMGGAVKQSDKAKVFAGYAEFRNRYKAALIQHGVDPEFAEMYMHAYEPPSLKQAEKSPLGYAQPLPPTAPGEFNKKLYDSLMMGE